MYVFGSVEYLRSEAYATPLRFPCPKCAAPARESCKRGVRTVRTHKEREARWREYCQQAPQTLAWLEDMGLPWFRFAIEEYLLKGVQSSRRKIDLEITVSRLDDARRLLEAT